MWSATIVNFLHIFATAAWLGGMVFMAAVFVPAHNLADPAQRGKLMGEAAKRFTIIAWASTIILLITGLIRMPSDTFMSFGSTYEKVLSVKIILFFLMILGGLIITFVFVPKMKKSFPGPREQPSAEFMAIQKKIETVSKLNLFLGIGVLICISIIAG